MLQPHSHDRFRTHRQRITAASRNLRQLRPSFIFLENVAALRTRGLAKVLGDLAENSPSRPNPEGTVLTSSPTLDVTAARMVVELECGITVYPPRADSDRWRAVWYEDGERRQCESRFEARLAAKLEKVVERLQVDAPNLECVGADLIAHYLDPDRLPVDERWSRKHADTQCRLCRRFVAPVIGAITCPDIKIDHVQKIVNAAPTAGEGDRVRRMVPGLVNAGLDGGYLTNPWLAKVHWQAKDRPLPELHVSVAGESPLWVDPAEIPASSDVSTLGRALRAARRRARDELMANTPAYAGLRWGELAALTDSQIDPGARCITVDRKVVEIGGHTYIEPPASRKQRRTIYARLTQPATRWPTIWLAASSRHAPNWLPTSTRWA
jgi:hypothetical protein